MQWEAKKVEARWLAKPLATRYLPEGQMTSPIEAEELVPTHCALAATVLGLKLTWFRLNLEREIQNFKSVIGSDQRDSREML